MNSRSMTLCAFLFTALLISGPISAQEPPRVPFPAWVFGHVVWHDESTADSVYQLVKGYMAHGIPADGVIIDSPWETEYNTFEFDPRLYPNARKLIDDLHKNEVRVIMWITSIVNFEDPAYQMCLDKGYFVKGREEVTWWKGTGGMIDYKNPEALEWWRQRMNRTIDMGIDGWKCDGTDPFMLLKKPLNLPKNWKLRKQYSHDYYSDFFYYTRERSGEKTLIMARPMEQILNENVLGLPTWTNPLGLGVYLKYAPLDTSFMSWVGDQDPTFDGLRMAARWILDSAKNGYLIVGSDIGGYRDGGPEKEVLIRWAQFGALCPFMENGGCGEHRPWRFDAETLRIYRAYTLLHKALLPYLYTEAVAAYQEGRSMMEPLSGGRDHYLLGRDILAAPVERRGGKMRVVLPQGDDWWPLFADESLKNSARRCAVRGAALPLLQGGCSFTHRFPLSASPVFVRAGSIIPLLASAGPGLFEAMEQAEGEKMVLMAVPPAPGKTSSIERVVYMEGATPVKVEGDFSASSIENVSVSADWPMLLPPETWPSIPENVDPIEWK